MRFFKSAPFHHHPYNVPEDHARTWDCANRESPETPASSQRYGRYYASVLYVRVQGVQSGTLALLWARGNGHGKRVSYQIEPSTDARGVADNRSRRLAPTVPANAQFLVANENFLTAWAESRCNGEGCIDGLFPIIRTCSSGPSQRKFTRVGIGINLRDLPAFLILHGPRIGRQATLLSLGKPVIELVEAERLPGWKSRNPASRGRNLWRGQWPV